MNDNIAEVFDVFFNGREAKTNKRACTIKITNKGLKTVTSLLRGEHTATLLETVITDNATGNIISKSLTHSVEGDTLTIPTFYQPK